ncbi:hypothetical protein NDU88_001465 [Pleurodeles waltl]|uniref:Uncharacterized protein n=1 Tax=Pleurodeles waltl TaxID=8319 RepID=A0AAV7U6Y4_PLEWA|nr:hypothetical protein NDU88_001465 [Pleurodeles waltl]
MRALTCLRHRAQSRRDSITARPRNPANGQTKAYFRGCCGSARRSHAGKRSQQEAQTSGSQGTPPKRAKHLLETFTPEPHSIASVCSPAPSPSICVNPSSGAGTNKALHLL